MSKSLDMLDVEYRLIKLGKNILKDLSKFWKVCIFANFACAYQGYFVLNQGRGKCRNVINIVKKSNKSSKNFCNRLVARSSSSI